MKSIKASVVTPIYVGEDYDKERRLKLFQRCIDSVANQDFNGEWEHIIVNDGSTIEISYKTNSRIKVINQENLQRLTAYNTGFKAAKGEIITMLDSDDEYRADYLSTIFRMYKEYPQYKMLNFGCKYVHNDGGVSSRGAFRPKEEAVGHEIFGGGQIVNGTFVFKKEIYKKLGAFPEGFKTVDVPWYKNTELFWTSPYDFSAYAQVEFPEIQPYFQVKHPDHPKGLPKELGNPFGQDYYLFYKYTRKYHSLPFDEELLIVNLR